MIGHASVVDIEPKEKGPLTRAFFRAGDRTRTGDPHLGKVMLYQLSHAREATRL